MAKDSLIPAIEPGRAEKIQADDDLIRFEDVTVFRRLAPPRSQSLAENDTINTFKEFVRLLRKRALWSAGVPAGLHLDRVSIGLPRGRRIGVVSHPILASRAFVDICGGVIRHHSGTVVLPDSRVMVQQVSSLTFPFTSVRRNLQRMSRLIGVPRATWEAFEAEIQSNLEARDLFGRVLDMPMRRVDRRLYFDIALMLLCHASWDLVVASSVEPAFHPLVRDKWRTATEKAVQDGATMMFVDHNLDRLIRSVDILVILEDGRLAAVGPVEEVSDRHAELLETIREELQSTKEDPYGRSSDPIGAAGDDLDDDEAEDGEDITAQLERDDLKPFDSGTELRESSQFERRDGAGRVGADPNTHVWHEDYAWVDRDRLKLAEQGKLPDRHTIGEFLYYNRRSDLVRLVGEGAGAIEVANIEPGDAHEDPFRGALGQLPLVCNDRPLRFRFSLKFSEGDLHALPILDVMQRKYSLYRLLPERVYYVDRPSILEFSVEMEAPHLLNPVCGVSVVVALCRGTSGPLDVMVSKNAGSFVFANLPSRCYDEGDRDNGPNVEDHLAARVQTQSEVDPVFLASRPEVSEVEIGRSIRIAGSTQSRRTISPASTGSDSAIELDLLHLGEDKLSALQVDFFQFGTVPYRVTAALDAPVDSARGLRRTQVHVPVVLGKLTGGIYRLKPAVVMKDGEAGDRRVELLPKVTVRIQRNSDPTPLPSSAPPNLARLAETIYPGMLTSTSRWSARSMAEEVS